METKPYAQRKRSDKEKEAIVHQWMEENIWKKFPDYASNSDRDTQLRGVDCEFTSKAGYHYICDEKAVTGESYINQIPEKKLKTFCLELSMRAKRNGGFQRYSGWLLNENEINNSFAFIWIDRTKSGTIESVDDILEAEVMIVRKDAIWDYIHKQGWDAQLLKEQTEYVLEHPDEFNKSKIIKGLKFSHPVRLREAESPVNILLNRWDYEKMADFHKVYKFD